MTHTNVFGVCMEYGLGALLLLIGLSACGEERSETVAASQPATVSITQSPYGTLPDGQSVEQYTMRNALGMEVKVITYGGIITSWTAPDQNGTYENIVLGFDSLSLYV
ncbi:MAG: hypothetical protein AAF399_22095, partial [Bacteroidota bacterium]